MMSKETLKTLGILGVSFGLIASPLAFGDGEEEYEPTTEQEASSDSGEAMGSSDNAGTSGFSTEYEHDEQEKSEWETSGSADDSSQQYEEKEWDEPEEAEDDEASTW